MTILKHELRQGRFSLIIWTAAIALMLFICILIYPDMAAEISTITNLFSNMGAFSAAFGMDKINFGEFIGFFGIECGNVLGLGGAFFAALIGIGALAKEEKEHTAEFLLTHPISRVKVIAEKLFAIFIQIIIMNVVIVFVTAIGVVIIQADVDLKPFSLLLLSYFLMQMVIAAITFGISAYLRGNSMGIGLGLAAIFYFLNIISNISDRVAFLKYLTPFSFTDGADVISTARIHLGYLSISIAAGIFFICLGFYQYCKKDIQ